MKSELIKIENSEYARWNSMIDDIEKYLKNKEEFFTMQQAIGFDLIFRGFIAKDWFRKN